MVSKFAKLCSIVLIVLVMSSLFCAKKAKEEEKVFATVGNKKIMQESFHAFDNMRYMYPAMRPDAFYPGKRTSPTLCVETEALYKKAKSLKRSIENSDDWKWKEIFFPAQMYIQNVLDKNLGVTKARIEAYYEEHKSEYKDTIKVKVVTDTTKKDSSATKTADTYKDSIGQLSLFAVRSMIVKNLFLEENPPTEEFFKQQSELQKAKDTSASNADKVAAIDTSAIEEEWYRKVRRNPPDFFMRKFFKAKEGKEYDDSLNSIVGEGKILNQSDVDVIMNWLPEGRRAQYSSPDKQRYLAEWLLKWKLFALEADKIGESKTEEMKNILGWALKYDAVLKYINSTLLEKVEASVTIDDQMCLYDYWDTKGVPGETPDSAEYAEFVESKRKMKTRIGLEKEIYALRKKAKVSFSNPDYKDDKIEDPIELSAKADSLYGAGETREAERIYRKLKDNFPFTTEGENAYVELAKILTEKANYYDAVRNYREFLQLSKDVGRRCNIFFMIGFIYGENLNKPVLAETNYKWILKNTPDCELSDDAEFMCLHLDEPMIGVEELRNEALRQGRKTEEGDESAI